MTHKGRLTKLAGGTRAPANTLDVLLRLIKPEEMPDEPVFVAGLIYHIAFRVPTDQAVLRAGADGVTPVRDRSYFHSISYRGHGRDWFEIAIEGAGFTIDEPVHSPGDSLELPLWFEPDRGAIEQGLPPITLQPAERVKQKSRSRLRRDLLISPPTLASSPDSPGILPVSA